MGKPPAALWLTAHGVHAAVTIEISMAHRSPGDRLLMQMVLIFFRQKLTEEEGEGAGRPRRTPG